mmetsp:Transcript_6310/g.19123  ORF Transcript_6310/g.19123 Transcript_6310/m.19123 type:complete len:239 (+) Transcript_6310:385-1101(+)
MLLPSQIVAVLPVVAVDSSWWPCNLPSSASCSLSQEKPCTSQAWRVPPCCSALALATRGLVEVGMAQRLALRCAGQSSQSPSSARSASAHSALQQRFRSSQALAWKKMFEGVIGPLERWSRLSPVPAALQDSVAAWPAQQRASALLVPGSPEALVFVPGPEAVAVAPRQSVAYSDEVTAMVGLAAAAARIASGPRRVAAAVGRAAADARAVLAAAAQVVAAVTAAAAAAAPVAGDVAC